MLMAIAWLVMGRARRTDHASSIDGVRAAGLRKGTGGTQAGGAAALPSPAVSANGAQGMEVCGIGHVDVDPGDPAAVGNYLQDLTKDAFIRWQAAMTASGDDAARAVGLYAQLRHDGAGYDAATLGALIQLAADSRDPVAYGIAYQACAKVATPAPDPLCGLISAAGWAKIDSDNAVPWILMAGQQQKAGNAEAVTTAMARAAQATRISSGGESLHAVAAPLLPRDIPPLESMQLSVTMVGYEAAWGLPYLQDVQRLCIEATDVDDRRRAACARLAELLAAKGNTADMAVAGKLGPMAGWPADRFEAMTKLRYALNQAAAEAAVAVDYRSLDCDAVQKANAYFSKRAQLGESGLARDYLQHSGKTMDELALEYHNSRQRPD
ncbi:MAG: hypothetical protein WDO12_10135 [Pseudomonadota bacterium]